ncbi:hypothetical protein HMPREF1430_01153 [Helicobacter pylori GAM96Ai]|nr:hypothetical protein HMPREF1430_01153 [Helicobacter pylori GAM96Ai]
MFGLSLADMILERFKNFMREYPEPYKFLQVFYANPSDFIGKKFV